MARSAHLSCLALLLVLAAPVAAEKRYGPGVSDTEIKIGQTVPYSGPLSAAATMARAHAAYFETINQQGGVNGRRIKLISVDDGYNPARTVEQIRKLVEDERVLLLFQTVGTPTNTAIHKYVNAKGVPHLFIASGATKWGDPKNFPWTMAWRPGYQIEARIYARYILENHPQARIAVLHANDDFGKDYLKGLKDGLGDKASTMIVSEATYESTDAGLDSQIVTLQTSGADTFINITSGKFAPLAIRKAFDSGWRPHQFIVGVSTGVATSLAPAGLDKAFGIISAHYLKDPTDPQWVDDPAYKDWLAWMKRYYPDGNLSEIFNVEGYAAAQLLVHLLKQCGEDLSRENVMRQAANLKDVDLPMLLPGIRINTSPSDFFPIEQMQLMRFDGKRWVRFGEVLGK